MSVRTELLAIIDALLDSHETYPDPLAWDALLSKSLADEGDRHSVGNWPVDSIRLLFAAIVDLIPSTAIEHYRAAWTRELDFHLELRNDPDDGVSAAVSPAGETAGTV